MKKNSKCYVILNFDGEKMDFNKYEGWCVENYDYLIFSTREQGEKFLLKNDKDDKFSVGEEKEIRALTFQ